MIEEQRKNGDFIQKLPPIPNAANLRPPFKATEYSVPAFVQPMGILINTRLVKDGGRSRRAGTISTIPKWKGKILSDDMRPLGSGNTMFAILQKKMGAGLQRKAGRAEAGVQPRHAQRCPPRRARRISDLRPADLRFRVRSQGASGQGGHPEGGRALRQDGFRRAEERAASERGAAVHPAFPRAWIRNCSMPMPGCCRWSKASAERANPDAQAVCQRQADRARQAVRRRPVDDGAGQEALSSNSVDDSLSADRSHTDPATRRRRARRLRWPAATASCRGGWRLRR